MPDFAGRQTAQRTAGDERTLTIFVYFRAAPQDRTRTLQALARHFEALETSCGLRGRGGLRRDRDKPYLTWLEVYEAVDPAQLPTIVDDIERCASTSGLAALAPEGRRREVFEALAPC